MSQLDPKVRCFEYFSGMQWPCQLNIHSLPFVSSLWCWKFSPEPLHVTNSSWIVTALSYFCQSCPRVAFHTGVSGPLLWFCEFFRSLVVEPESETSSHVKRVVYHRLYRSLVDVISDNSSVVVMVTNIRNITNKPGRRCSILTCVYQPLGIAF